MAFSSEATNLVNGDSNNYRDIFLRDRDTDDDGIFDEPGAVATSRIMGLNGQQPNGDFWDVSISADGRFIAFASEANNLVVNDYNTWKDIFVYDQYTGWLLRASLADDASESNAELDQPSLLGMVVTPW